MIETRIYVNDELVYRTVGIFTLRKHQDVVIINGENILTVVDLEDIIYIEQRVKL
jgi:hypothetical protein